MALEPQVIRQILDMRREGKYLKEIAKELKIDPHTVRKYTVLYGLDGVEALNPHWTETEADMIRDLYLNKGMTPTEIANRMKKSNQAVRKYLIRHGIRKPRKNAKPNDDFSKPLPKPVVDPVFYPARKITKGKVVINGKKYQDISELYGI